MPNKKLIRHYQWQVRRLNRKINEDHEACNILFHVLMTNKPNLPCEMPIEWLERREKEYLSVGCDVPAELCVLRFWFNARNAFVNRIAALSGY